MDRVRDELWPDVLKYYWADEVEPVDLDFEVLDDEDDIEDDEDDEDDELEGDELSS